MRRPPPPADRLERDAVAARIRAATAFFLAAVPWPAGATPPAAGRIVATHVVPAAPLAGNAAGVRLGGLSDLVSLGVTAATPAPRFPPSPGGRLELWAITDRGPNGTREEAAGRRRTLIDPGFVPALVRLDLDPVAGRSAAVARVGAILPLANRGGRPLSGRPNGVGRDEPIVAHGGGEPIPPDPDGIDPEGVVRLRDGSFWIAEEYRPSLLEVSADGRGRARFVPEGGAIPDAGMEIHEVLPAAYGSRRDNRGFEALAVSPDESRLWILLQSPLDHPVADAAASTGNVRLLAFDVARRRPAAEHLYRLGDPSAAGFLDRGAPPADGKLCAIAAIAAARLLVLEQSAEGVARLYDCSLAGASDTLGREAPLETVADLPAAGIVPVGKLLVADLSPLLPAMARDVAGAAAAAGGHAGDTPPLKLEGLTILGPRHVAIVNDDDFGVDGAVPPAAHPPRTCLWIVELDRPFWSTGAEPSAPTR